MRIKSNDIVILDTTDTKKLDVHISSNHPTIQIYDQNTTQGTYTPDWSNNPLVLTATIYADSTDITNSITSFKWSRIIGDGVEDLSTTTNTLTISNNDLNNSTGMVIYKCVITYNNRTSENRITFARTDVGKNGSNGNSAPAVKAQYSIDGVNEWTSTLNSSTHKYIRFSYDNGTTWTTAIKISGEDGKSVQVKGVAYSKTTPVAGQSITLYSDEGTNTQITSATEGDSYLVAGYLCVYNGTNFVCTGQIQGPQGKQGDSYYLFIRYASDANGTGISASSSGKTYIGFYRSSVNQVPTDTSTTTWNWAKFAGEDAKIVTLTGSAQAFKVDKSNVVSPATIKVTAQIENTTISNSGWSYSTDGGQTFSSTVPTGVARNGNIITLTGASIGSNSISIKATDGTHSDVFTVYKVLDGTDGVPGEEGAPAYTAFLSNESIAFVANSSGEVDKTTVYSNVVVYKGTEKVAPTIGTISGLPTGMSITSSAISGSNELQLAISITDKATLGSINSAYGSINIPITAPIGVNLKLNWSKINSGAKGDTGIGIKSVTVTYGTSTSASTQPATWQSSIPTVAEGSYLWTRTVTDYTDDTIADTVTYTYAKQGKTGETGSTGSSVTVSKIEYQSGTSATTAPTGTWSSGVVSVTEGSYLWTKTTFSDNKVAYGVAKQGTSGRGVSKITKYYLATSASSSVTTAATGWTTSMQNVTSTNKYLWSYEIVTYTDNATSSTTPVIIGVYGDKGVDSVTFQIYAQNGYLLTKDISEITLQTFAYEGSTAITSGATYQWSHLIDNAWTAIDGATSDTFKITKADVLKAKSYRCTMTYKSKTYTSTVTVQDKTDIYNSIMCISSNATNNDCYWVLYTLVYSDTEEIDPLLGPISVVAPTSPKSGDYWYSVDATNATVALKKYNGTSWANSTDTQSLSYYWDLINDGSENVPLGASSKVKVVSCHDFTATATLVCEVSNVEDGLLTQSSLSITDASDPIVSETEPTATVNGQIWIKPNSNGTYLMFVWDASLNNWISSDMDTRSKVYTSRPSSYNAGDLWITASDTDHGSYLHGTLLQAQKSNTTYSATDWSPTLRYDQDIDNMKETLNNLSQYVTITSAGLRIGARSASGELSPFTSLFTSTELSFYQNSEKLLTLANNKLTAPRIEVEDDLIVQGSISLGNLKLIIESNGSFSFAVQK